MLLSNPENLSESLSITAGARLVEVKWDPNTEHKKVIEDDPAANHISIKSSRDIRVNSQGISSREVNGIHPFSQWSFPCTSLHERSRALWATVKSFAWLKPIGEDHTDPDVDSVFFVRIFETGNEYLARIYLSRRGNVTDTSRHRRVMGHFGRVGTSWHLSSLVRIESSQGNIELVDLKQNTNGFLVSDNLWEEHVIRRVYIP